MGASLTSRFVEGLKQQSVKDRFSIVAMVISRNLLSIAVWSLVNVVEVVTQELDGLRSTEYTEVVFKNIKKCIMFI